MCENLTVESSATILRTRETSLKPGIYIIPQEDTAFPGQYDATVMFWPEPTTWNDDCLPSVERNRVTFMRWVPMTAIGLDIR